MSSDSFTRLLTSNLCPLRMFLQARLKTPDQSDDVLQQALLHAFARRDQLRRRPKFKSVGSSRVDLQACKLEYSIVSPK